MLTRSECGKLGGIKSGEIMRLVKADNIIKYNKAPKICLECGIILSYDKRHAKFCSHNCSAKYGNKGRIQSQETKDKIRNTLCDKFGYTKHSISSRKKIFKKYNIQSALKNCIFCGKLINKGNIYCSRKCQHEYEQKEKNSKIEKNEIVGHRVIKKYLINKKNECSICNTSEWLGNPILLILDHIDGDSDNSRLSNCRLVCSNCDATLPTYKNKNKNGTRFTRRKRYADGKTY